MADREHAFLIRCAQLLHTHGTPAHRLERVMVNIARSLGVEASFLYTPTSVFASFGTVPDEATHLLRVDDADLNLGKLVELDEVMEDVEHGRVDLDAAMVRLTAIAEAPPRWRGRWKAVGFALASGGAARFFGGGAAEIAISAAIGPMLFALGRRGLVGGPIYDVTGFVLPFSIWGVIIANTFVAMPFLVITVEAAFINLDQRFEGAAATLGASRLTVFRRVTLPMIAPSLAGGLVLTWARALGEFGATLMFAGNLSGKTQTLTLAVYTTFESDMRAAQAISLVLVVVAFSLLYLLTVTTGRSVDGQR